MSESNNHKVPLKHWRKWTPQARKVFNETYETMLENQGLFLHPKQATVPQAQWKTTAWNAAWTAADAVVGAALQDGDVVSDVTPKGKVVRSVSVKRSSRSPRVGQPSFDMLHKREAQKKRAPRKQLTPSFSVPARSA